ncbi:hypothetical protein [Acetobacter senegalensis]|uniref:hypothetical protein n=1 Tax=Acetobacter senegalensis TaxID=446692 RepID=UPI00264DBEED|nr:hypothetical protein [Acetobacter senegalensis]MDN7355529.1 hypothetical protein [Acetobacter senegalensis]
MIPLNIAGSDVVLRGGRDGVRDLFARRIDGCLVTRWEPTPDELAILNRGGSVELWCLGTRSHPPVRLQVAEHEDEQS